MRHLRIAEISFLIVSIVAWTFLAIRQIVLGLPIEGFWFATLLAIGSSVILVVKLTTKR